MTFDVFQDECVCTAFVAEKLLCPWGKPQERVHVSEDVLMLICAAGVALRDIRCVSGGMCVHGHRGTKVAMSMGEVLECVT